MSFFRLDNVEKTDIETAAAADSSYAALNSNYAAFKDGATYSYTDGNKVAEFKDQADGEGSDITTVTVDRTLTHGTKENPYVIDSYAKWMTFARENGYSHNGDESYQYGYGKVWVLATDIVFNTSSQPFLPVWGFGGEFYGLGHTLSNITYNTANINSDWATSFNFGIGVFCNTYTGGIGLPNPVVIADLNVDNYKFTNCGQIAAAVVGRSYVKAQWVLNCHASGTLERASAINNTAIWGGIIAGSWNHEYAPNTAYYYKKDIAVYRCSAKTKMVLSESTSMQNTALYTGGILGCSWLGGDAYVWDCFADTELVASGFAWHYIGGVLGVLPSNNLNGLGGYYEIKDCVSNFTYNFAGWGTTTGSNVLAIPMGSVFSFQSGGDPDGETRREHGTYGDWIGNVYLPSRVNVNVSNTYSVNSLNYTDVAGNSYLGSGTKKSNWFPVWSGRSDQKTWYDSYATVNSANNYYASSNKFTTATAMNLSDVSAFSVATGTTYISSESSLFSSAKSADALKSKIWENKANIGATYSIANSPLKNSKISPTYKVEYFNLKADGNNFIDEPLTGAQKTTYTYGSMTSLSLSAVADTAGRKFLGWTTDKTGKSEPIRSVDMQGMNGNLKFYALWDVTDTTAELSTLNDVTEAERGDAIYLRATVNTPSITDPVITYTFLKDGEKVATATGKENNEYVIDKVEQNGLYSLDYTVYDREYPLMRHTGGGANSIKLEITQKSTTLKRFTPSEATPAYAGAPLSTVEFTLVMEDNGKEVAGTATWQYPTVQMKEGVNRATIVFKPGDSATYKDVTVEVEIEAKPLTLTFHIPDIDDFVVNIDYDQDYSAEQVVAMFEEAYAKKIAEDPSFEASIANRTPKLDGVEINKYDKVFAGATTPQTIEISFTDPKAYDVLLDYGYDNKKEVLKSYWNKLIPAPATADRGGNWVLTGWFVTVDGTVSDTKWDFSTDRVTANVTLTAIWVEDVLSLDGITVTVQKDKFTALTTIDKLGLTVTATFHSSLAPDEPVVKTIPLKSGDGDGYEVFVEGMNASELHVGDTSIEVCYGDFSETVEITVDPIRLNNRLINFPPCTKDYIKDTPQTIDPLTINSLPAGIKEHVFNIVIEYFRDRDCLQPIDEVIEEGTYYVRATFNMVDDDHELLPITTRFIISPPRQTVTVSWDLPSVNYVYSGEKQFPTAVLTAERDGVLSAGQYEYLILNSSNAMSDGIDADTYTIKIVFAESVESVYKFAQSAVTSTRYTISKMKVQKPVSSVKFEYSGEEKYFLLDGFEESYMSYTSDSKLSGTDAGTYTVRVQLDKNHEWTEGGTIATYSWTIDRAVISRPTFNDASVEYNSLEQSIVGELFGFDESKMVITGEKGKNAGSYTARVTPSANYTWDNADTPVSVSWTITKRTLYIEWESEDTYEKDGTKRFSPKIVGFDGLAPEDKFNPETDAASVKYSGDVNKSAIGSYVVKFASLTTSWAGNYEVAEDAGKGYRIIAQGADPDDPNNPVVPDPSNPNGGGNMGNNGGNMGNTPSEGFISALIPIILSGISLVLIIVFAVMTLNYNSAAKAATDKAKRLAKISYSFAPAGLLAVTFGLSVSNWWIIAGVLMGLALVMAIVAFTFKGKKRKALLMLEEEQERVAEEKELAKEEKAREEQARRDNELRMMFASMQQNYQQPQMNYGDMQNMIASTVSALLPGLQQQMALPPASPDGVYAQPAISAAAQIEIDGLHAQIAQQNAQMAQQREMMEQILQNQQAQQAAINEALYEEPEPEDDISWLGENDEVISLEESYGALSDEGKRAYYEIGSYIMNKPRTSQNDGRYAVLFKYRGRTVFKLAIKDDAPVLYYPTGSRRSEVRVCDAASLEVAKSMIDRTVMNVDQM